MPYGLCAGLWLERSGFKTLPGQCIVFFGRNTLLSKCLSVSTQEYRWVSAHCQGSLMKSGGG